MELYNFILDGLELTVVCTGICYVVGKEGIKFGWSFVKTVARLAVGK